MKTLTRLSKSNAIRSIVRNASEDGLPSVMAFTRLPIKHKLHNPLKFFLNDCIQTSQNGQTVYLATSRISYLSPFLAGAENLKRIPEQINQNHSNTCIKSSQSTQVLTPIQGCPLKILCPLNLHHDGRILLKYYSTSSEEKKVEVSKEDKISKQQMFKKAIKEYGSTVIIFHVSISLMSLGICYLAVSSGLNLGSYMPSSLGSSEIAADAGMFVVAYAVHKVLAPVRISITLFSVPFIVRYLRKINVLKP